MLVPTLTEAPSETISYLVGLTGAAEPTHVSSSRLTAAGIHNSGWCREQQMARLIALEGDLGDKGQNQTGNQVLLILLLME